MEFKSELLMPNAALTLVELLIIGIVSWLLVRVGGLVIGALAQLEVTEGKAMMGEERTKLLRAQWVRAVKLLGGLGALTAVAYNAWLMVEGYNAPELVVQQLKRQPLPSAQDLAVGAAEVVGVLILLKLIGWIGAQLRQWMVERLIAAEVVRVEDERLESIGHHFMALVRAFLWLLGATLLLEIFNAPEAAIHWVSFAVMLAVVWCLVQLISDSLDAAIDAIYQGLMISQRIGEWAADARQEMVRLVRALKLALRWAVYIGALAYVVRTAALSPKVYDIADRVIQAAAIIVGAQVALAFAMVIVAGLGRQDEGDTTAAARRRETMLPLVGSLLRYVVYFVAGVMALQVLGVDVTAILAGAGIVGLAIGFGAQSLVQDVLSGFFTLFEGCYLVGDYIEVAGQEGTVEAITLRTTSVRARDGRLYIIPNGEIKEIANYSKDYVNAVVDVGVSYEGDLEQALEVLEQVGMDAERDLAEVTGPPETRVRDFGGSEIALRLTVPVEPGRHRRVASELRRRIKASFDAQGVEIPFARQVVILQTPEGEAVRELPVRLVSDRDA